MNAGDLRDRVIIHEEVQTPDGQGGYTTNWTPIAAAPQGVWAKVIGLTGDEALAGLVERSTATWRVTIRKRPGITTKHRLIWDGRTLNVKSVLPDPKEPRAALLLICESEAV
jgi:SPP1 family predicted phage head-tail adaptor